MTDYNISDQAQGGQTLYEPASPFRTVQVQVDFANHNVGASGADTLQIAELGKGEFVHAAYLRVDESADAGATVKVGDSRTGGGALVAASAADAAAGTYYTGAGAGLDDVGTSDAFLTLTTGAATAATQGKVTVYAIIGCAFA